MEEMTCCAASSWVPQRDLGSVEGFEYLLGRCGQCGTPWLNVFCVATGITGYERVTSSDVEAIQVLDGRELKEFMRRWGNENL